MLGRTCKFEIAIPVLSRHQLSTSLPKVLGPLHTNNSLNKILFFNHDWNGGALDPEDY